MVLPKLVGERIKRREDPRLVAGTSTYVDDMKLNGMLYCGIVRSVYGHAKIKSIDTEAARQHPGVFAVITGEDLKASGVGTMPVAHRFGEGLKVPPRYPLAVGEVNFAGEAVAAVVATDRYVARDAVDLVNVEYEPLPVVVDVDAAYAGGPFVHEEFGTNVAFEWAINSETGTPMDDAEVKVSQRIEQQRLAPVPMEGRAVLADYDKGKKSLTLFTSTQIPHLLRTFLSLLIGLPENHVRVVAPEVGGGFGMKLNVYPEEGIAAALSMKLGKPIKWIESRAENMSGSIHGRGQVQYVDVGATKEGKITALHVHILADLGAYHQLLTPVIPTLTGLMLTGPYTIANLQCTVHGIFTNKVPTDAYRGAGRPEATYLIERVCDLVAHATGVDPIEVRRRNFIDADKFPYTTAVGLAYDSGNYQGALEKALEHIQYDAFRAEQAEARKNGKYLGIGFSTYVEVCGMGPSAAMPAGFGWESCTVRVDPTGKVTVTTGASPHGQGQETTFAQITAEELGVGVDDVLINHGDTAGSPYGVGTFGSRGTAVGGAAMMLAIEKVQEKAKRIAAHMLEASVDDITFENGKFGVKGAPDRSKSLGEIAWIAYTADTIPASIEPGLEATSFFEPPNFTYPFGTHIAFVEVDAESGEVALKRYVAVDDCGRVINPMIVDGQVHGGLAQGIAQALFEEVVYDDEGQLITGSLMDYALPTARGLPSFELDHTTTPSPVNPLGVKGVGEAGTIGSTPAIVNAVVDALAPFGVTHIDMPLRGEKLWRLMHEGK
ncbi:MAG TPA: molybdopterin cofactor-binding domain-containing protein [Thermomicrobiales bacterium]